MKEDSKGKYGVRICLSVFLLIKALNMVCLFVFVVAIVQKKKYNYSTFCKYPVVHTQESFSGVTHKVKKWFQNPIPVTINLLIQSGNAPSNCLASPLRDEKCPTSVQPTA